MNRSGESVGKAASYYKVSPEDILIIHDELDLPFGTMAFKRGGGTAGHNGLKSIAGFLGTGDFLRLRLGIGRPTVGEVADFVLSSFSTEEEGPLEKFLLESGRAVETFLKDGLESAMTAYNKKSIIEECP